MKKFIVKGLAFAFACLAVTGCAANVDTTENNRNPEEMAKAYLAEYQDGVEWDQIKVDYKPDGMNGDDWMSILALKDGEVTYCGGINADWYADHIG